jgi:hypothetical protein
MRRVRLAFVALLGCLLAASGFLTGTAGAASYPPVTGPTITVSTTTPTQGQTIEVGGANYGANESVRLTIGGILVGTATTDSSGAFEPAVVVPTTLIGAQPLTGVGLTSGATASLTLTISAPAAASSNSGSGLAFTGEQIAGALLLAVVLLAVGGGFALAGRRRRQVRTGY